LWSKTGYRRIYTTLTGQNISDFILYQKINK